MVRLQGKFNFRVILPLSLVLFIGVVLFSACKKIEPNCLKNQIWVYSSDELPDSIAKITDNILTFRDTLVYFNDRLMGHYEIKGDIFFIHHPSIQPTYNSTTIFKAKIIQLDGDVFKLKRISGHFLLKTEDGELNVHPSPAIVTFTNRKKHKRKGIRFESISFTSLSQSRSSKSWQVSSKGELKFREGNFQDSKKEIDYVSTIKKKYLFQIIENLSYLNLQRDSVTFSIPYDADEFVFAIRLNGHKYYLRGSYDDFQPELDSIKKLSEQFIECKQLRRSKNKLDFDAKINLPIEEVPINYLP